MTDGQGEKHRVQLDGFATLTKTSFEMESEQGDYIGQGQDWSYDLAELRHRQSSGLALTWVVG